MGNMEDTKLVIDAGKEMIRIRGGTSHGRRVTGEVTSASEDKMLLKSLCRRSRIEKLLNGVEEAPIKIKRIEEGADATN